MCDDVAVGEIAREGFAAQFELVQPPESADIPAIYSNFIQATITPLDLTLHLGWYALPPLTEAPTETIQVEVRPLTKVSLPINLVPGVIRVLQAQMDAWQETFARGETTPSEVAP